MAVMDVDAQVKAQLLEADLEAGNAQSKVRWAVPWKVHLTVAVQLLLTAGVAASLTAVRPIHDFLHGDSYAVLAVFFTVYLSALPVIWPMWHFRERHPVNVLFFALYSLCTIASVGLVCSMFLAGKFILVGAIVTLAVVVCATLFTLWATRRGHDLCLIPHLKDLHILLPTCFLILYFYPWPPAMMFTDLLAAISFSAMLIWDTKNLISGHNDDGYIYAAVGLYLDVVNLFLLPGCLTAQSACVTTLVMHKFYEAFMFPLEVSTVLDHHGNLAKLKGICKGMDKS